MVGACGKRIAVPLRIPFFSFLWCHCVNFSTLRAFYHLFQRANYFSIYDYIPVGEIDVNLTSVMDSAAIADQNTVHIDPGIIIPGELELHVPVFSSRIENLSIFRHRELRIDMHAAPEFRGSKRPEASVRAIFSSRLLGQCKCAVIIVVCFIITTVILVVSVFVHIKELIDSGIAFFPLMGNSRIKQIGQ